MIAHQALASLLVHPVLQKESKCMIDNAIANDNGIIGVRCRHRCDDSGFQCYKHAGHKGSHSVPSFKMHVSEGKRGESFIILDCAV